ncbi:hypothetical protein [Tateyamaria sp. SN3-11]|uniref:hypothetical protein n=1 Tax=Tateyamaria sp. SN3-11 TaxID=3092147 RepID=UPI0039ED4CA4
MPSESNDFISPLFAVRVGSLAMPSWGQFRSPVVQPGYTRMLSDNDEHDFMSGTSICTNTKNSMHFEVGISGSYGSPVAKFSGGLGVGYSSAHAESDQSISISMNAVRYSGVELLDFDNVSFDELLSILDENVAKDVERVLDKFNTALASGTDEDRRLWANIVLKFYKKYGSGMVVAVVWGGWGEAKMDLHVGSHDDKWALSQTANFTYSGLVGAASVNEALGLTGETSGIDITGEVTATYHGGCVSALVKGWEKDLMDKLSAKVSKIGDAAVANLPSADVKVPDAPEAKKPPKKGGVADKIDKIKDLDGLKAYAQASAYDKYMKDHPDSDMTLEQFLDKAKIKTDLKDISDDPYDADIDDDGFKTDASAPTLETEGEDDAIRPLGEGGFDPGQDFIPLGAWIAPWGNIFPWLVIGQNNDMEAGDTTTIKQMLKVLAARHAFNSLTRIYARMHAEGLHFVSDNLSVESAADEFSGAAAKVTKGMQSGAADGLRALTDTVLPGLSKGALTIYKTWMDTPALRQCELGAGVLIWSGNKEIGGFRKMAGVTDRVRDVGKDKTANTAHDYTWDNTAFDYEAWNLTDFSADAKAWPYIEPTGDISAFVAGAPAGSFGTERPDITTPRVPTYGSGVLISDLGLPAVASFAVDERLTFSVDPKNGHDTLYYVSDAFRLRLIPLSYSAAQGLDDWWGCSMTPDLSDTKAQVTKVRNQLSDLDTYGFDVSAWTDSLSVEPSMDALKSTYVGLVPEPPNVFPK